MQEFLTVLTVIGVLVWALYPSKDCKCNGCNCYLNKK